MNRQLVNPFGMRLGGYTVSNDLIEIARFPTAADAALARNRLEDADISACLDGEAMAGWFWHFGSSIGGVRLLVANQDAERAADVLAMDATIEDDDAIDFGDDSPEEIDSEEQELSAEITRAFRASVMGAFLLPPLLNIYSTYLIFRHRLFRPPVHWKIVTALLANSFVFFMFMLFVGLIMTPQEPPREISLPDGTPLEIRHEEETVPIHLVP